MKRQLPTLALCAVGIFASLQVSGQRFLSEVFPSVQVTQDVIYANNYEVLTGTPVAKDLMMDVYEPSGAPDPMPQRPLIIYLHTGTFLPPTINRTPTGSRRDSATVAMCMQFAKRGYVVASIYYRLGWNPAATGGGANEDIRRGTLLAAVYRSIQDAKAAVRYFRKDAATTDVFKIDPNKIILGGQGSGGYTALAYATLNDPSEIALPKFIANYTIPAYGFVAGQPFVNQAVLGDFDGYGGLPGVNNPNNSIGYPNNVQFVFNMGGCIGDSIWMAPGDAPMVAVHVVGDPFGPYGYGPVINPTNGDFVVDVSGSKEVIKLANNFGNNNCFNSAGFTDILTTKAIAIQQAVNGNSTAYDGLYPFVTNPLVQSGPWEWFDSLTTVAVAVASGLTALEGGQIYANALLTNPDMSKAKALAYIDTIQKYFNPRIVYCLNLPTSVGEISQSQAAVSIFPNPVTSEIKVNALTPGQLIESIEIADLSGKRVYMNSYQNASKVTIDRNGIASGIYFINVRSNLGSINQKLVFK